MSRWNDKELRALFLSATPLIDVRAPVEFAEGALPHSVNLPIMNNVERHQVGTCYKEHGQNRAIELGHQLVSGEVKASRISDWKNYIQQEPRTQIFCFRGGLRSQIACQWLTENGITRTPIAGGYKRMRNFFLSYLEEGPTFHLMRLGGCTGSGKTRLLQKLSQSIDIEKIANHRGSAFGNNGQQPAQATFENHLALELMKLENKKILVEDESATLGSVSLPRRFFTSLRTSPLVILNVSREERIQNIFEDYVQNSDVDFFLRGLNRIEKKLGKSKTSSLAQEISRAFGAGPKWEEHAEWITILLDDYYDPLYQKDLRFNHHHILFQGTTQEVTEFWRQQFNSEVD